MDGTALVYCEGAFGTPYGKTANGLVRHTARYELRGVIESRFAGRDAGEALDGQPTGIPIFADLDQALAALPVPPRYLVIGLAPDGGRLPLPARREVERAISRGINIDSGLHEFIAEDEHLAALARERGVTIRDVRRPPPRSELHFFSGKIAQVKALKLAVLGTDSAVGKRTTAVRLNQALNEEGIRSELIGTGQTSWMQGVKYGLLLDSLVNDFVSGEIEHAIYEAWRGEHPEVILLEGQGAITHPAYPGGFELIAAGRVDGIVLQHAPRRKYYDGFDGYLLSSLEREILILELLSRQSVLALTLNHEGMTEAEMRLTIEEYEGRYGRPTTDVLWDGCGKLVEAVKKRLGAA
jgi:uncharacterized NAD-dependent epimerase/dehydratase family protein